MATTEKRFVVTGDQAIRLGKVEPEAVLQIELSPADQGFTEPPTWKEFACNKRLAEWSRAVFEGYIVELNPAEVGPHMAIQYTGQPNGEVIWIAMETVPDSHGFP